MAARRGQQAKRDEKRATRDRETSFEEERGGYRPPRRDRCEERQVQYIAAVPGLVAPLVLVWKQGGRIVDFQITIQVNDSGLWRPALEIDCQHGHVHSHYTGRNTPRGEAVHLYTLNEVADVLVGLNIASVVAHEFIGKYVQDLSWEEWT